jgi:hypothetical protein
MQTSNLKKWLSQTAGLERAVAYSVSGRIWQIIAGGVGIIVIAHFITRAEQGYLYTFLVYPDFGGQYCLSVA